MQRSADREGGQTEVDAAFDDPAFAVPKARGAAFAVVRSDTRELVWANDAAAVFWGSRDRDALSRILFGASASGMSGWLGRLAGSFVPGRPAQLARRVGGQGLDWRGALVLGRAWVGTDGAVLLGFAVPQTGMSQGGAEGDWRRGIADASHDTRIIDAGQPSAPADGVSDETGSDVQVSLAERSQLAILRDRLTAAADGSTTLRLLWRTDRDGVTSQIDEAGFRRLGCRAQFKDRSLAEVVEGFDPAGAAALRKALASRATWSGLAIRLPVAEGAATAPLTLAASPVLAQDRSFGGYRGFGTLDLGQLGLALPRPGPTVTTADARTPTQDPETRPAPTPGTALPVSPAPDRDFPAAVRGREAGEAVEAPPPPATAMATPHDGSEMGHRDVPPPPDAAPQRATAANVVQLWRTPLQAPPGDAPAAPSAAAPLEATTPDGSDDPETSTDELAFLALGDALRAQIDAPAEPATADVPPPLAPDLEPDIAPPPGENRASEPERAAEPARRAGSAAPHEPESDSFAARLFDQLPMALVVFTGGRPVVANRAAADLLGYAGPADLVSAGPALVISGAGQSGPGSVTLRTATGAARAVDAAVADIALKGTAATLWTLDPQTFAAAPPAEPAPRSESIERATGELLDRVDDAVALLDAKGAIRHMNRRGVTWFERPGSSELLGQSIMQLLTPDSRGVGLALLNEVSGQRESVAGSPLQREVLVRTLERAAVPMLLTMGRLGIAGLYATLRDVSALRRAEAERAQSQRALERDSGRLPDVLAKVSHEIRTPLNAILGFAEVMSEERFGPIGNPRYKDYLRDIHASGTQVMTLVSDLLDLSRIQAGQLELDVGAVDVNKIVTETVSVMQPEAHRERVIMRMSLGSRIPAVLADERSARQIVQNLLSNAVRFNEPGGQVIVSTALSDEGDVVLRVRDTGIGMTEVEIAAALEPFQRVSSPGPSDGNGLGLPLTRALIGANGASMAIRSRPREGTLVEVAFAPAKTEDSRRQG